MNLTPVDKFKKITGYDIENLFNTYIDFVNNNYSNIINYYKGADIDKESFNVLENLRKEVDNVESLINQYGERFTTTDFWEMNNIFSEIQTKIMNCENMGKWQRSSRTDRFSENIKIEHIQKQNETIEQISNDAGFDGQDSWADISVNNFTNEEDYTNKGGKLFKISLPNNSNFNISNVVDYLIGDNIYGKDIDKKITITPDGDLKVKSGKESLKQIFEIIMSTVRGGIPEFPDDGIPSGIFGTNQNVIQYPIMFRSFLNMFQKDKRFKTFELLDINKSEDSIFLEFRATTIIGDNYTNNVVI
jgi:hypothetical protein